MIRSFVAEMGAALALAGCAATPPAATPSAAMPDAAKLRAASAEVLFWSQEQRDRNFPHMEALFPGEPIHAARRPRPLPAGAPLAIPATEIDAFIRDLNVAGVLVLDHGRVRLERYARGFGPQGRYTSFSVAKSLTSTLVGAAVKDGAIASLDDPVVRYVPELAGGAYDGVTVRQVLTMTSGVKWNEDYTDPNSDVARMYTAPVPDGVDPTIAYLKTLTREAPPGSKWSYKTGETNLIGTIVMRATRRGLADYASEKIARPAGFERDGFWMTDTAGGEIGGCCLSLALRDYARMGLFAVEGGRGQVPAGWFRDALSPHERFPMPGFGYGYQWWTYPGGAAGAQGIYGQSIYLDPARQIVIVTSAAYSKASGKELWAGLQAFDERVVRAIAAEGRS